jgi:hypothetical protein
VFTWGCTRPGTEEPIAPLLISIGLSITRRDDTLLRGVAQKAVIFSHVIVRGDHGFLSRGWLRAMLYSAFDRSCQDTADEVALHGEEYHQWQGH